MDLGLVNIVTLRISLSRSATAAFLMGLGSIIGDLIYFSLAAAGATALLGSRRVRMALWIFGTTVLVFLAAHAVREIFRPKVLRVDDDKSTRNRGLPALFFSGIGLALASPSAILWFAAVGGSVIASYGTPGADNRRVLLTFAAGFATAGIAWAAVFAYGAAALKRILGSKLVQGLSLVSAILFLYFATDIFVRGLREFY
jgi:L-lysine exporter family protein LysE/ArgO